MESEIVPWPVKVKLIRVDKSTPLGPYRSPMPGTQSGLRGVSVSYERGAHVQVKLIRGCGPIGVGVSYERGAPVQVKLIRVDLRTLP